MVMVTDIEGVASENHLFSLFGSVEYTAWNRTHSAYLSPEEDTCGSTFSHRNLHRIIGFVFVSYLPSFDEDVSFNLNVGRVRAKRRRHDLECDKVTGGHDLRQTGCAQVTIRGVVGRVDLAEVGRIVVPQVMRDGFVCGQRATNPDFQIQALDCARARNGNFGVAV